MLKISTAQSSSVGPEWKNKELDEALWGNQTILMYEKYFPTESTEKARAGLMWEQGGPQVRLRCSLDLGRGFRAGKFGVCEWDVCSGGPQAWACIRITLELVNS